MIFTTILLTLLAVLAAVFGTLYFQTKKHSDIIDQKIDALSEENNTLKLNLASRDVEDGGYRQLLTKENIMEFLRNGKANKVESRDSLIRFEVGDSSYLIDTDRLPRQLSLRKGYDMTDSDIDWDVLEAAGNAVTEELVMVKVSVDEEYKNYVFYIVSADRYLGSLKDNYEFYMSILVDAESRLATVYHQMMEIAHPELADEQDEQQTSPESIDDLAKRIASSSPEGEKIQS